MDVYVRILADKPLRVLNGKNPVGTSGIRTNQMRVRAVVDADLEIRKQFDAVIRRQLVEGLILGRSFLRHDKEIGYRGRSGGRIRRDRRRQLAVRSINRTRMKLSIQNKSGNKRAVAFGNVTLPHHKGAEQALTKVMLPLAADFHLCANVGIRPEDDPGFGYFRHQGGKRLYQYRRISRPGYIDVHLLLCPGPVLILDKDDERIRVNLAVHEIGILLVGIGGLLIGTKRDRQGSVLTRQRGGRALPIGKGDSRERVRSLRVMHQTIIEAVPAVGIRTEGNARTRVVRPNGKGCRTVFSNRDRIPGLKLQRGGIVGSIDIQRERTLEDPAMRIRYRIVQRSVRGVSLSEHIEDKASGPGIRQCVDITPICLNGEGRQRDRA